MKTNLIKLFSLLLALVLMLPLIFSCGDETPTTPSSIPQSEKTFDQMNEQEKALYIMSIDYSATNKRMDMKMRMDAVYSGINIYFQSDMYEAETGIGTDSYINVNGESTDMDVGFLRTISYSHDGYADGKMFHYQSTDSLVDYREWSAIDLDSYLAYRNSQKDDSEGLLGDYDLSDKACNSITCKKDGDGNWVATFTDFTDEGIEPFASILAPFAQMELIDISAFTGVTVKATVDANFKPISADIIFNFTSESQTTFTANATFTYGDDVTIRVPDLSEYTQVDDIRE